MFDNTSDISVKPLAGEEVHLNTQTLMDTHIKICAEHPSAAEG